MLVSSEDQNLPPYLPELQALKLEHRQKQQWQLTTLSSLFPQPKRFF